MDVVPNTAPRQLPTPSNVKLLLRPSVLAGEENMWDDIGDKMVCDEFEIVKSDFAKIFRIGETQQDVWRWFEPYSRKVFEGFSCSVLSFGPQLSGKSYTLFGSDVMHKEECGVVPRIVESVFDNVLAAPDGTTAFVGISAAEIFKGEWRDLFEAKNSRGAGTTRGDVRDNTNSPASSPSSRGQGTMISASIEEPTVLPVQSVFEALSLLDYARKSFTSCQSTPYTGAFVFKMIVTVGNRDIEGTTRGSLQVVDAPGTDYTSIQLGETALECMIETLLRSGTTNIPIPDVFRPIHVTEQGTLSNVEGVRLPNLQRRYENATSTPEKGGRTRDKLKRSPNGTNKNSTKDTVHGIDTPDKKGGIIYPACSDIGLVLAHIRLLGELALFYGNPNSPGALELQSHKPYIASLTPDIVRSSMSTCCQLGAEVAAALGPTVETTIVLAADFSDIDTLPLGELTNHSMDLYEIYTNLKLLHCVHSVPVPVRLPNEGTLTETLANEILSLVLALREEGLAPKDVVADADVVENSLVRGIQSNPQQQPMGPVAVLTPILSHCARSYTVAKGDYTRFKTFLQQEINSLLETHEVEQTELDEHRNRLELEELKRVGLEIEKENQECQSRSYREAAAGESVALNNILNSISAYYTTYSQLLMDYKERQKWTTFLRHISRNGTSPGSGVTEHIKVLRKGPTRQDVVSLIPLLPRQVQEEAIAAPRIRTLRLNSSFDIIRKTNKHKSIALKSERMMKHEKRKVLQHTLMFRDIELARHASDMRLLQELLEGERERVKDLEEDVKVAEEEEHEKIGKIRKRGANFIGVQLRGETKSPVAENDKTGDIVGCSLRAFTASSAIKRDELNRQREKLNRLSDSFYDKQLLEFVDECDRTREQRRKLMKMAEQYQMQCVEKEIDMENIYHDTKIESALLSSLHMAELASACTLIEETEKERELEKEIKRYLRTKVGGLKGKCVELRKLAQLKEAEKDKIFVNGVNEVANLSGTLSRGFASGVAGDDGGRALFEKEMALKNSIGVLSEKKAKLQGKLIKLLRDSRENQQELSLVTKRASISKYQHSVAMREKMDEMSRIIGSSTSISAGSFSNGLMSQSITKPQQGFSGLSMIESFEANNISTM